MKRALSRKNLWDKLPPGGKAVIGRLMAVVPTRYWLGRRFRATCRFLQEAQWWTPEQIHTHQLAELRRVCTFAYHNATFYRRWFDHAGLNPANLQSLEDFASLPTTDKTTVHENLDAICTVRTDAPGVDFVSTGGTSGQPLHFYMDARRSAIEYAYLITSWKRVGYDLAIPMVVLRGRVVPPDRFGLRHAYDPLLRHHYYSSYHLTDQMAPRYLAHLRQRGPCFLHVYPSSAAALARYLRRSGETAPTNVKGIIAESEIVYPEQRKMIESTFGCRLFSCYGHTEKLVLAAECEHSNDDHVWPTYGYFELLDDDGKPVKNPGQRGEIVGTGFIDTVTPFIRYRTGDFATYVADHCSACGRNHPIIRDIRGHRTQEFLVAADGAEIAWAAMNMHDDTFAHVRQFQFRQEEPGRAVLRIVPAPGYTPESQAQMMRSLRRKLEDRLAITVELVDDIPLSPRGKAIYVDQQIPAQTAAEAAGEGG